MQYSLQIQTLLVAQKPKCWWALVATVFTEQKDKQKRKSVKQSALSSVTWPGVTWTTVTQRELRMAKWTVTKRDRDKPILA